MSSHPLCTHRASRRRIASGVAAGAAFVSLLSPAWAQTAHATACLARSGPSAPVIVELYTSEGCNSCPPADKWLSTLKPRNDVFAFAFHVDYWDRLGWIDRFASPAWTQRQNEVGARSGAAFIYTPQIVVNGRDYRKWPSLPASTGAAGVDLQMTRDGAAYVVQVSPNARAARDLAGYSAYWAVTEDDHRTQVRNGENAGVALHHDAVVRELVTVPRLDTTALRFSPRVGPDAVSGAKPRRISFVVTDARSGEPVQAVRLDC